MRRSNILSGEQPDADVHFRRMQQLVYQHTAIVVSDDKLDFVKSRVAKRLRHFNIDSLSEYCDRVESGEESIQEFTSLITTNHTSFFRESHHFDIMVKHLKDNGKSDSLIWSCACSTGEEPYSIAIALHNSMRELEHNRIRVLASDIDDKVIETAKAGIYSSDRLIGIGTDDRRMAFEPVHGRGDTVFQLKSKVRNLVEFRRINLVEPLKIARRVNVIFCRNVAIYFDRQTKVDLFRKFADLQVTGDMLFIGHSENLNQLSKAYACIGGTAYRRL